MPRTMFVWMCFGGVMLLMLGCGRATDSNGLSSADSAGSDRTSGNWSSPSPPAETASPTWDRPPVSRSQGMRPPGRPFSSTPLEPPVAARGTGPGQSGDRFAYQPEDDFRAVLDDPYSTFSVDVDTASFTKARQYLIQQGTLPPADAVRIEEFVNYFHYDYAPPTDGQPVAIHAESSTCPWRPDHRLVRIGIQACELYEDRPACNLVFLVDVSGSMNAANRLPLVKQSLEMLLDRLDQRDRVAIVVYSGEAGLALPSTCASQKHAIKAALRQLHADGSTNGGEGIALAYRIALDNFREGGVNRVILCTDGDFNVGVTSPGDLVRIAEEKARSGVFLTVLGFGMGNHNDALLEAISNKANGNYAFIDTASEAHRAVFRRVGSMLVAVAKDVKVQVEFNPALAAAYRLIGYENRRLADRDFNDDRKDAGDMGAGHTVTVLYEVVPSSASSELRPSIDPLKYQASLRGFERANWTQGAQELLTVKLRFKHPAGNRSDKLSVALVDQGRSFDQASADFRFAAAVAAFGMRLRNSPCLEGMSYRDIRDIAQADLENDTDGDRAEFTELVARAAQLSDRGLAWNDGAASSAPWVDRPHRYRPTSAEWASRHSVVPSWKVIVVLAAAFLASAVFLTGAGVVLIVHAVASGRIRSSAMTGCGRRPCG